MNCLPENYEDLVLSTTKNYINLSKLPEGEHRFRVVQEAVVGWIDWFDSKPFRYRTDEKPEKSFDPHKPMKPFFAFYVWSYERSDLFIMEITQVSVLKALIKLYKDEDWGDFMKYDVKFTKEGTGKDTRYHVSPVPHSIMRKDIKESLDKCPVNLEALYDGEDPWSMGSTFVKKTSSITDKAVTAEEERYLDELIGNDSGLRANILNFLSSNGYGNKLGDMPRDMYPKMVTRAMQSKNETDSYSHQKHKEYANDLTDFAIASAASKAKVKTSEQKILQF